MKLIIKTLYSLCLLCVLVGCNTDEPSKTNTTDPTIAKVELTLTANQATNLAAADRLDGTEDHNVHRCYTCQLGMDGKKEHAVKVDDYQLDFCSKMCVEYFVKQPGELLENTAVPSAENSVVPSAKETEANNE